VVLGLTKRPDIHIGFTVRNVTASETEAVRAAVPAGWTLE
jgi:hypothetical protein